MAQRGGPKKKKGSAKPDPDAILETNDMRAVMVELKHFAYWKELGTNLGLHPGLLNIIESEGSRNYDLLSKVIENWLKRNYTEEECEPPTWRNLANAIKPIDMEQASKIEKKCGIFGDTADEQPEARQPRKPTPSTSEKETHVPNIRPNQKRSDQPEAWAYMYKYLGITGLLLAIVGGVWFVVAPPSTPPSTPSSTPPSMPLPSPDNALTCKWPKPNSNPVLLQEKQIMMELDVEEMSDKLKTSVEQVGKALIAAEKCKDPELHDKMNMVDTTLRKIKEKVQEVYGGFHNGAETALTNLRSMSYFATKGNMVEAMQQMDTVCETTEALAQQLDSLKGSMQTKGTELRQALKDLEKYQEKAKDNYESQQDKVRAEKQQYARELTAAATSAREADEKASSAATNAKKEMEAWEELKRNNDAFGSNDQNPFKKRRDQFLKDQQTFEAKAEDSRRFMEQAQLKITAIEKDVERANVAFKCTSDAITKTKEAAGSVSRSMLAVSVSLFEEGLKKECEDLHDTIKSISSSGSPKDTFRSKVCSKAIKLFAKWQALSKVSLNYFSIGDM